MGYTSLFFGRMNDKERLERIQNKTMEFLWKPEFADGNVINKGLFTHLMYDTYISPCGIPMTNYWNPKDAGKLR